MELKQKMRKLNERQARNCEEACEPVCRCRCGGKLHGAKRGGDKTKRIFFESLPEDDPHYIPSAEKLAHLRTERIARKKREHAEAMNRRYLAIAHLGLHDRNSGLS